MALSLFFPLLLPSLLCFAKLSLYRTLILLWQIFVHLKATCCLPIHATLSLSLWQAHFGKLLLASSLILLASSFNRSLAKPTIDLTLSAGAICGPNRTGPNRTGPFCGPFRARVLWPVFWPAIVHSLARPTSFFSSHCQTL